MKVNMSTVIPALAFCQNAIRRNHQALHLPSRWVPSAFPSATRGSGTSGSSLAAASSSTSATAAAPVLVPRAAVSTVVQCRVTTNDGMRDYHSYYLLVQRGKEPNLGMWSLPGGKLEWGEPTLEGARRELDEETSWLGDAAALKSMLKWYHGTVCATDSIGNGYHYVIAQCFAQLTLPPGWGDGRPPRLAAADDAAAVGWFTREEMQQHERRAAMTPGVLHVIDRVEDLSAKGLLPVH